MSVDVVTEESGDLRPTGVLVPVLSAWWVLIGGVIGLLSSITLTVEKIELLRTNPVTRDLPAVKENRFINLPYAMWTAGPLNIDAAEHVRKGLEHLELVPASDIVPELKLPASVPGQEYFS